MHQISNYVSRPAVERMMCRMNGLVLKITVMKKHLHITASFDRPDLLQNLAEQLAYRRIDPGYRNEQLIKGFQPLETSTTDIYVSGTIAMDSGNGEHFDIPFITGFLFTCTRGASEPWQMNWSCSLS